LGLAIAQTGMGKDFQKTSHNSKRSETALETTYKFNFGRKYSIQPCLQYIINPDAGTYSNCFVSLLRFSMEY
jgi:carbohydrate-selective porin OprB